MKDRRGLVAGIVFVVIGVAFLLQELDVLQLRLTYVAPVAVIGAGVWILATAARRRGEGR